MKFLLLYKGDFGSSLRGPELRYYSLASSLLNSGNDVYLCGRAGNEQGVPNKVTFVPVSNFIKLMKSFFDSDIILLHGGGPLIMILALFSGFLGKKIILDCYVPHWIELDEIVKKTKKYNVKLLIKSYFNVARSFFGVVFFNAVIVANQRQLDLMRGMMAPFWLTHEFSRIHIISYGCDEKLLNYRNRNSRQLLSKLAGEDFSSTDFLIGWLGGAYGWFDMDAVIKAVSEAVKENKNIKLVLFGVENEAKKDIVAEIPEIARHNIFFLPWIDFSKRMDYWAGLDISLVWGGAGYENDYDSRTRNFDCLTLGLPIIQNKDSEWGARLDDSGAGKTATLEDLPSILVDLSYSPDAVNLMSRSMENLAAAFYWDESAEKILNIVPRMSMRFMRRLFGFFAFLLVLPAFFVSAAFVLISYLTKKVSKR
jgi:glycosyltransferase involved in cell wall biosynthesis